MELMRSRHSLMPRGAQTSFSASRSLSTPVEVSQCVHQSQAGREPAARARTASASNVSPHGTDSVSNSRFMRRAWSARRSPNSPLTRTSPRPRSSESCAATASLASVPDPRRISARVECVSWQSACFTAWKSCTKASPRCDSGACSKARLTIAAEGDRAGQEIRRRWAGTTAWARRGQIRARRSRRFRA